MATVASRTWVREFAKLFPLGDHDPVDCQLARLIVLYEDLRIEVTCASVDADALSAEVLGKDYRQLYFIRRSFATLEEFRGAFHQLNMDAQFKKRLRGWPTDDR